MAGYLAAALGPLGCHSSSAPGAAVTGDTGRSGAATTGGDSTAGGTAGRANAGGNDAGGMTAAGGRGGADSGGRSAAGGGDGGTAGAEGGSAGAGSNDARCGAADGQLFDSSHPWNQPVDDGPTDAESDAIIGYLQANHTAGAKFRIDGPSDEPDNVYGITVLSADADTPHETFERTGDFYSPDCDYLPMPVPATGATEGEPSYACESDGDCHLLVIDTDECRLYEMWRANRTDANFEGGCLAVWDLTAPYVDTLRGDCCTSADAAGLPISALMFDADEVMAGEIRHALRFILPNSLMRERIYVRPATHSTGATSGPADAPPYGSRMRLRSDFDLSSLGPAAQVVATALQRYGMILSDGGNITFTASNDRFTTAKWADVGLGPGDLTSLEWTDFEVVELGERFTWDGACNCSRTPLTE